MIDEPPFGRIAIVGLGLIGGSIALGVRERWPSIRLTGIDRQAVLAHALGGGAIDRAAETVAGLEQADLVILAAPVRQNLSLLADVGAGFSRPDAETGAGFSLPDGETGAGFGRRAAGVGAVFRRPFPLITDVGGTKRGIVDAARSLPAGSIFIGGHPIGGAERGGFGFARADMFKGRPWIFTPQNQAAAEPLDRLSRLVEGLGARPHVMAADAHDRLMAVLSHLPQLAASALMQVVGVTAGAEGLRLAGRGLVDTTRLASSPAGVWRDICTSNADAIGPALDELIAALSELRRELQRGETIEATFEAAARWRTELMKGRE